MKTFTFTVVIEEGNDEFWESLANEKDMGITTVTEVLKEAIEGSLAFDPEITLTHFEYKPPRL